MDEMFDAISNILSDMDDEMKACLAEKTKFQIFEHVCGPNRVSNFRNALLYIKALLSFKGKPGKWPEIVLNAVSYLLKDNNTGIFLSSMSSMCQKNVYLDSTTAGSQKREATENLIHYPQSHFGKLRRKRFYSQYDMMDLFNKIICNKELMISLAEYWDTHYGKFDYSRSWMMGIISETWCCWIQFLYRDHEKTGW